MLTRSVVKAFLTNRYVQFYLFHVLRFAQRGTSTYGLSVTTHNHQLPEDVLLEIFDAYRQLCEHETLWNSIDGWLKLVHVCLQWRRVLLLSTCRLHVHMLFTPSQPSRGPLSRCLTRLPIWVDYSTASWNTKEDENLALAALEQRSLVRGIALGSRPPDRLLSALSRPFPQLESLDIGCSITSTHDPLCLLKLPSMFFPSLQRLTLRGVAPSYLSPLLSSAKGLVELALTLSVEHKTLPEYSLIKNLQNLSCLRRLELKLTYFHSLAIFSTPAPPTSTGDAALDVATLSKLTDLTFIGDCSYLQMLVVALAAPSLQRLDVEIYRTSPEFPIPQLCKFIRDTENQFVGVSLYLFQEKLQFSADTGLTPDYAQSFNIIFPRPFVQLEEIGNKLSGPLSTVEELVIECRSHHRLGMKLHTKHHIQWEGFFNHLPQVKVIRVAADVANEVAHSFKRGGHLSLLPSLEEVKVDLTHLPIGSYMDSQFKTIRDVFKPLIATRKQAGRRVILSPLGRGNGWYC